MKSLVGAVFLLLFVLLNVMCCEGCWKQEREALIAMKSSLRSYKGYTFEGIKIILSWTDSADCCEWDGVECNTTTGRVTKLRPVPHIEHEGPWELNYSDFAIFKDLKTLDLSGSRISNCTRTYQGLNNLEVLDLSGNYMMDNAISILSCVDGLPSLKSLSLADISYSVSFHDFQTVLETISSKLLHLEALDIGYNNLSNEILPSLRGFTSLKELYLSFIGLDSDLHIQGLCASLKNLEILDISRNNFNDTDIASALSGLASLKSLNLQYSGITLKSIHRLSNLTSLKILDFSENQIVDLVVHEGSKKLNRLDILALDSNMINGSNLQESLRAFQSIRNLTMRRNKFKGTILAGGFRGLINLEHLELDYSSNLQNEFFKSIGDLPSLKVLSASYCGINGTLPIGDWYKLKKLEELDLSYNEFVGQLPSSFVNMTSLRTLALTDNHFIGNIGPTLARLTSLEYLNFEGNQFEFPISFTPFFNHSNLKFIYGNGNKVILDSHSTMKTWVPKFQLQVLQLSSIIEANSIPLPKFLHYQNNLAYVDFTDCKLRGEFPNWLLQNNTKMEDLILANCSFIGEFQLPPHPYLCMETIDVSNNALTGQMLSNNISSIFPKLIHLNMSINKIHGSIPYELGRLSFLDTLDLSDNHLSGEIPHNISGDGSQLSVLSFSNNQLHGPIPFTLSMFSYLRYMLLNGNSLSGTIPGNFFNSPYIENLDLSDNNFIGEIPRKMENSGSLFELSMSNNHFKGSIPSELAELRTLTYLDLSQNNLVGCVPSFLSSHLTSIHLSNNKLSCLSKNMFRERSSLVTLDLSNNEITNGFHDLMHDLHYTGLEILLLKGNRFNGNIPKQLCNLTNLNILDLSYNNFVGEIPSCLGKMPFENKDPEGTREQFNEYNSARDGIRIPLTLATSPYVYHRFGKEKANFTSKKRSETYTTSILVYMSGIDLSHNKLNGSIPAQLGNLTKILALNLSNNYFTGEIPATFSDLVHVESLDLSFNMLSGQIPPQLDGLTSLEVFNVAHNNLSGATPERKGQFITFDESSYEGNQFLCGPPLPKSCNPCGQTPATLPDGLNKDADDDSWVDMYVFRVSFVVAYTSILLVIPTVLYINPYWRQAWFYYIGLVCMNCYYFIEDNLYNFF